MQTLRAVMVYGWLGLMGMTFALAVEPIAPGLVDVGIGDFRAAGYVKAFNTWSFGGPLEQDSNWNRRLAASAPLWNSLGRCLSYDDVRTQPLTAHTQAVTLNLQFERGEVFFRFVVYTNLGRTTITAIDWTTDIAQWEN